MLHSRVLQGLLKKHCLTSGVFRDAEDYSSQNALGFIHRCHGSMTTIYQLPALGIAGARDQCDSPPQGWGLEACSGPLVMANGELDEESLQDLYSWVDAIPLSRPKKNITRDFSDGGRSHGHRTRDAAALGGSRMRAGLRGLALSLTQHPGLKCDQFWGGGWTHLGS